MVGDRAWLNGSPVTIIEFETNGHHTIRSVRVCYVDHVGEVNVAVEELSDHA